MLKNISVKPRQHATKNEICSTCSTHNSIVGDLYGRYRSEKSFFGYSPSVLKSGIQKYARRAEVEKGLWCLVEMDLFGLLEHEGPTLDAYLRKYPEESASKTYIFSQKDPNKYC